MKRVYARFVGRAHPTLRGYAVEHALRKLADDQRNPPEIASIALKALHEGPHVLPILADELEETNHPMKDAYNWRAIPRGIAIDQAALAADRELGSPYHNLGYQPGNNISLAWLVNEGGQSIGEAARMRGHNALRRIRGRIADSVPDATPDEMAESIRRLALTRQDLTNSEAYPMLARQHHAKHNATHPAAPGASRHDDARRFRGTQVLLRRRPLRVCYASFPGADQPTVTVRVPVPTPAPMTKKKPQQPVLQKFGNTVAPAPPPQPTMPGMVPQQSQDQDFAPVPFAGPRTIIFPHSPPPKKQPVQPRRMNRPVRYAADPHGTEFWNPPPHHQADPMVVARRDRDPLWNYHRGITGYGGGVPMYGEKPAGWHAIDMTQTGGWNEDATHPPPEGLVTHRHARERWGGAYAAPGSEPSPDQLLRAGGDARPGPRQAFAPIDDWVRLPGDFNQQHPANRDRYNALFDFHGTGRRPWYQAVFPLQELSMHSEQNDPYGLLSSAVITGNRHAVGPLVDLLKKRDNPAGWWKGWATLHKAMTDRIGDLPPQEVIRRVGAIADATGGHSESPNEHARIANSAKSAAESGDFLGYVALADHMEENGLPQYAQLVRAELANVIHGLRGEPKGRRRFSRPTPQRV